MSSENDIINVTSPTPEARRLWAKTLELAKAFGVEEQWVLIGGLMVQLHGFERASGLRPTADIDLLGDTRSRPAMTKRIAEILVERGGEMTTPPRSDKNLGYIFELDGEIVATGRRPSNRYAAAA